MSRPSYFTPTLEQVKQARADYAGFCRSCGAEQYGTEPDAERYECEACGEFDVYGAEEYLMNEWVTTTEPPARLAARPVQARAAPKPAPVAPAARADLPAEDEP